MIDLVERDNELPSSVRRRASDVRPLVADDPDLAITRLLEIATSTAAELERVSPRGDLAKCTGVETFYSFYLAADVRPFFRGPEEYRRRIELSGNREALLLDELSWDSPLVPAENSWLTEWKPIADMTGTRLRKYLSIRPLPPFILLVLTLRDLLLSAVTVRSPRAVDAIPHRLVEWVPGGLPGGGVEYVDGPIARSAVSRVAWRP